MRINNNIKDKYGFIYLKHFNLTDYYNIINNTNTNTNTNILIKSDCELFPDFEFKGYIDSVRPAKNNPGVYIIYFKYKTNNTYKTIKIDSSMYKLRYKVL